MDDRDEKTPVDQRPRSYSFAELLLPIAAAVAIAVYFVGSKHLLDKALPAVVLTIACTLGSGLILAAALLVVCRRRIMGPLRYVAQARNIGLTAIIGAMLALGYLLSMLYMRLNSAESATIISTLEPVMCVVFGLTGFVAAKRSVGVVVAGLMFLIVGCSIVAVVGAEGARVVLDATLLIMVGAVIAFVTAISVSDRLVSSIQRSTAVTFSRVDCGTRVPVTIIAVALTAAGTVVVLGVAALGWLSTVPTGHQDLLALTGVAITVALSWVFLLSEYSSVGNISDGFAVSVQGAHHPRTDLDAVAAWMDGGTGIPQHRSPAGRVERLAGGIDCALPGGCEGRGARPIAARGSLIGGSCRLKDMGRPIKDNPSISGENSFRDGASW